jgi:hypothetical protein
MNLVKHLIFLVFTPDKIAKFSSLILGSSNYAVNTAGTQVWVRLKRTRQQARRLTPAIDYCKTL